MAVPKQRHNQSRRKRRTAGQRKLKKRTLISCADCGKKILPHTACPYCGKYRGRKVTS